MNTHTPGPWTVNSDPIYSYGLPSYIWGPKGPGYGIVCELPLSLGGVAPIEADAHLIAAAPDLLAACVESLRLLRNGSDDGYSDERIDGILSAAIAKAKGGAA